MMNRQCSSCGKILAGNERKNVCLQCYDYNFFKTHSCTKDELVGIPLKHYIIGYLKWGFLKAFIAIAITLFCGVGVSMVDRSIGLRVIGGPGFFLGILMAVAVVLKPVGRNSKDEKYPMLKDRLDVEYRLGVALGCILGPFFISLLGMLILGADATKLSLVLDQYWILTMCILIGVSIFWAFIVVCSGIICVLINGENCKKSMISNFDKFSALSLNESQEYDLLFLEQEGFVRAAATGRSITEIHAEIKSMIGKQLNILIKVGTYFVAQSNCQNMVVRNQYSFKMEPYSVKYLSMNASCINATLPIPNSQNQFIGVRKVSNSVERFLNATQNSDPMVVQAGVWALTDNYSDWEVQMHLIARDQYGRTSSAISYAHIAEARNILNKLGLHHRL